MAHNKISKIKEAFAKDKLSHALLLETHLGAATGLESLFQTILCQKRGIEACMECESCLIPFNLNDERRHPDFMITRPGAASGYSVEQVRDWESRFLYLSKNVSPKKLLVITQAEKLAGTQNAAANALLKVLEEPRPHTHLILLTSNSLRLLATIRSRSLKINLKNETPAPDLSSVNEFQEIQEALWGLFPKTSDLSNPTWWKDKAARIAELEEKAPLIWRQCTLRLAQSPREEALSFWTHWKHFEDFLWAVRHYGNPALHWLNFKRKVIGGQPWRISKLFG
ncbi:MAG: hypothetical protein R3A80_12780 [Bdellovibrionota bacterium]